MLRTASSALALGWGGLLFFLLLLGQVGGATEAGLRRSPFQGANPGMAAVLPGPRTEEVPWFSVEDGTGSPSLAQGHFVRVYDRLLAYVLSRGLFHYPNNRQGRVAWNTAYFLDSLLNMFLLTGNTHYLDVFVAYGDEVLRARDDMVGRSDFTGRARPGWQTNAYYTLGQPYVLPAASGAPALRVQGIHLFGNNRTVVRVISEDEGHFTLEVSNDFRRTTPDEVRYRGLTMDTVEQVVNAHLSPWDYIRVQRLGSAPPAPGSYPLRHTYPVVLHGEHTPGINAPFVRFAAIVRRRGLRAYQEEARLYLQNALESYQDYAALWRTDASGGYFIFDPQAPFWCAGCPVPYNGLALHGRFLLWLSQATGEDAYRQQALALAHRLRLAMKITPEGTLRMSYWYGTPFQGWSSVEDGPTNRLYAQSRPFAASEDVSHFTFTLRFLLDALDQGWPLDENWARAAARTYVEVLWRPDCVGEGERALAHSLEGGGCVPGFPAGVYVRLSPFHPQVWRISHQIYEQFYKEPTRLIGPVYPSGYVLLGWSLLASQSALVSR